MKKLLALLLAAALLVLCGCTMNTDTVRETVSEAAGEISEGVTQVTDTIQDGTAENPAAAEENTESGEAADTDAESAESGEEPGAPADGGDEPEQTEAAVFTAGTTVTAGGMTVSLQPDGLYRLEDGNKYLIYNDGFRSYASLAFDGDTVYCASDDGMIQRIDPFTGSCESLFALEGLYDVEVFGADADGLYIGTQATEDDWWGYEVTRRDYTGAVTDDYGGGWNVYMTEGILCLEGYRSDVSPTELTVIDVRTGDLLAAFDETEKIWGFQAVGRSVYYICVPAEEPAGDFDVTLERLDDDGTGTVIRSWPMTADDYWMMAWSVSDGIALTNDFSTGSSLRYEMTTGEEVSFDFLSGETYNWRIGTDAQGERYYVNYETNVLWRMNASGELYEAGDLGDYSGVIELVDDGWAWVRTDYQSCRLQAVALKSE